MLLLGLCLQLYRLVRRVYHNRISYKVLHHSVALVNLQGCPDARHDSENSTRVTRCALASTPNNRLLFARRVFTDCFFLVRSLSISQSLQVESRGRAEPTQIVAQQEVEMAEWRRFGAYLADLEGTERCHNGEPRRACAKRKYE